MSLTVAIPSQAAETIHVVRKGHTLSAIARRYHTTVETIRRSNRLKPGQHIVPGQRLRIDPPRHRSPSRKSRGAARPSRAQRSKSGTEPSTAAAPEPKPSAKRTIDPPPRQDLAPNTARGSAARHARKPTKTDRFARKPKHPGFVSLVRYGEVFRGQLVNKKGGIPPKAHRKVARLMRDLRTKKSRRIDPRLLTMLARVSDHFGGRTIVVVSGYRAYRAKQHTRESRHNVGQAIDFRIVGVPNEVLRDYCLGLPRVGVGYYPNSTFVHLDVRHAKAAWTDYSRPGERPRYAKKPKRGEPRHAKKPKRSQKRKARARASSSRKRRGSP